MSLFPICKVLDEANRKRARSHELRVEAHEIEIAVSRGKRWQRVKKSKPVEGFYYLVRRVWADKSRGEPVVALWSSSGWVAMSPYTLHTETGTGISLEVWI